MESKWKGYKIERLILFSSGFFTFLIAMCYGVVLLCSVLPPAPLALVNLFLLAHSRSRLTKNGFELSSECSSLSWLKGLAVVTDMDIPAEPEECPQ